MIRIPAIVRLQLRNFRIGLPKYTKTPSEKGESPRMKKFHEQLKVEKIPSGGSGMRFIDLVLVETNSENGELVPNSEKEPTKWGDWQHGGRVTDF